LMTEPLERATVISSESTGLDRGIKNSTNGGYNGPNSGTLTRTSSVLPESEDQTRMKRKTRGMPLSKIASPLFALLLSACADSEGITAIAEPAGSLGRQHSAAAEGKQGGIHVSYIGGARNPATDFGQDAAEIAAFDASTHRLLVVNASSGHVDVFDLSTPSRPEYESTLSVVADLAVATGKPVANFGAVNSLAIDPTFTLLAVAVSASPETDNGYVAFYRTADRSFLQAVEVGPLPDMLIFTPNGMRVLTANEGEPSADYTLDPEGSISIINLSGGVAAATISTATFTEFDFTGSGAVIFGPNATPAQDVEPEYIAVSADSSTAYVVLQENNALAVVDIESASVDFVTGFGFKDHRMPGNGLDASNRDGRINIRNWPVYGVYQPDAIAAYSHAGKTFLVTANEGDAREYEGFVDEQRIGDLSCRFNLPASDMAMIPDINRDGRLNADDIRHDAGLGRLKVSRALTVRNDGLGGSECTALYAYGGRSLSIWDASTGERVYDSGDDFEVITARQLGMVGFNQGDRRSDDKGPEPEAVTLVKLSGRIYAFIALERTSGFFVYDISVPSAAEFVQYVAMNTAIHAAPESGLFIPSANSPNGNNLFVTANELSGTIAVYEITETND